MNTGTTAPPCAFAHQAETPPKPPPRRQKTVVLFSWPGIWIIGHKDRHFGHAARKNPCLYRKKTHFPRQAADCGGRPPPRLPVMNIHSSGKCSQEAISEGWNSTSENLSRRKKKISALLFKICPTYFKICPTFFYPPGMPVNTGGARGAISPTPQAAFASAWLFSFTHKYAARRVALPHAGGHKKCRLIPLPARYEVAKYVTFSFRPRNRCMP